MLFMQYAAPPPFRFSFHAWLDNDFPGQWMRHKRPTEWPLHFYTCNFYQSYSTYQISHFLFLQITQPSAILLTPATSPNKLYNTRHILVTINYSLHSFTTYASAIFFFSFFFFRKDGVLRPFFFFLSFLGDSSVDMSFVGEPYHNETTMKFHKLQLLKLYALSNAILNAHCCQCINM